jgi:hypothetical protein
VTPYMMLLLMAGSAAWAGYLDWAEARHSGQDEPMPVGCGASFVVVVLLLGAGLLWAVDHLRILP